MCAAPRPDPLECRTWRPHLRLRLRVQKAAAGTIDRASLNVGPRFKLQKDPAPSPASGCPARCRGHLARDGQGDIKLAGRAAIPLALQLQLQLLQLTSARSARHAPLHPEAHVRGGGRASARPANPSLAARTSPAAVIDAAYTGDRGCPSSRTDTMLLVMMSADGETLWTRSWVPRGSRIPRHARAIDRPTVRPTTRCAQPRPQDPAPLHTPRPGLTSFSVVTQRWVPRAE